MAYTRVNWEDSPSTNTPISASNLNKMDKGIKDNYDEIQTKATLEDIQDNLVNVSNEVDNTYKVNLIKGKNLCSGYNQSLYINSGVNQATIVSGNTGLYIPVSGGDYTISTTDTQTIYRVGLTLNVPNTKSQTLYSGINKDNTSDSITIDTTGYDFLCITCTDLSKIQIEKGSTATTYEEFVPNSILVDNEKYTDTLNVGTSLDNRSRVNVLHSKNLFDYNNYTINNTSNGTFTIANDTLNFNNNTGNAYVITFKKIKVKPNTTYTLNGIPNDPDNNNIIYIKFEYDSSGTQVKQNYPQALNTNTFTTTSTTQYIELRLTTQNLNTQGNYSFKAMLNEGSEALPYEPYITPSIYVDNEEIYNRDKVEPILWWTNSTPTSSFSGQAISIPNFTSYKYFEIIYREDTTTTYNYSSGRLPIGSTRLILPRQVNYVRNVIGGANGITFGDGQFYGTYANTTLTTNNNWIIPYMILLYK